MHCTYITDSTECGREETTVHQGQSVCREHRITKTIGWQESVAKSIVSAQDRIGSVYIVRIPSSGNIKIGKAKDIYERFQKLEQDFGQRLELLASTDGYSVTEAELHVRFADSRDRTVLGEQFVPTPELLAFVDQLGLDAAGLAARDKYSRYVSARRPAVKSDYFGVPLTDEEIEEIMNELENA